MCPWSPILKKTLGVTFKSRVTWPILRDTQTCSTSPCTGGCAPNQCYQVFSILYQQGSDQMNPEKNTRIYVNSKMSQINEPQTLNPKPFWPCLHQQLPWVSSFFLSPLKLEIDFLMSHIHSTVKDSVSPSYGGGCAHALKFLEKNGSTFKQSPVRWPILCDT